ncbi:hypothetical protein ACJMK2_009294 [Sinanodonta woodiana]|uniref:MULE transposase domain-containing protein n=1 Tax=Sinanodonta woodiana TaxID=1069815 RepID=A0ABD3VE57_SINWO
MEFGSDDEKAITKAIDHVFPSATRYLCTKHLKDNVRHYLQNKIGIVKGERDVIMAKIFGTGGITNANTTIDFDSRSEDLETIINQQHPTFAPYFISNLKPRLKKYVFEPSRNNIERVNWTNNNAESINNILKLSVDWKPKHTQDLINKLFSVTQLHFMDYRSALHDSGNYQLTKEENIYKIKDSVWRCKSEIDKTEIFAKFLKDIKRTQKSKYITSQDGKYTLINKARGTARKPGQRRRPVNERTKKH